MEETNVQDVRVVEVVTDHQKAIIGAVIAGVVTVIARDATEAMLRKLAERRTARRLLKENEAKLEAKATSSED